MTIRPIGQGGFVVRTKTTEIIIDPYISNIVEKVEVGMNRARLVPAPFAPADVTADAVICTHDHLDHLDTEAAAEMRKGQYFITTAEGKETLASLGQTNVLAVNHGDTVTVGDMELFIVYARHSCDAFGVVVRGEGFTAYFSGDTWYDKKLFAIADMKPDATFICINGRLGNMNTPEAIVTAEKIGARFNIPAHYNMFASNAADPHLFADNVKNSKILEFNVEYDVSQW